MYNTKTSKTPKTKMGNQICGEGTAWKLSEMKCTPQSSVCGENSTWNGSKCVGTASQSFCGANTQLQDGKCVVVAPELTDAVIAAQATNGYDLATGYCDLDSLDANTKSVKVSDCYATCASNADCAAFVFQNADPGNTTCWLKATSNAAANTCTVSNGLSSTNKLVPSVNSTLSYYEVKPNSVGS